MKHSQPLHGSGHRAGRGRFLNPHTAGWPGGHEGRAGGGSPRPPTAPAGPRGVLRAGTRPPGGLCVGTGPPEGLHAQVAPARIPQAAGGGV